VIDQAAISGCAQEGMLADVCLDMETGSARGTYSKSLEYLISGVLNLVQLAIHARKVP
jgi:hypothetical protein